MSKKITNNPTVNEEKVNMLRGAIEHRATWFYLLLDEAKKAGADREKIGREAIFRCGCFHGDQKLNACEDPKDMKKFMEVFADETTQKVFEMETVENTENSLYLDFHYCPLVNAWKKAGASDEDIEILCDIAMDGDRGICSRFHGYEFKLDGAIAAGDPVCKIRIDKE